jgi:hypothetical protein
MGVNPETYDGHFVRVEGFLDVFLTENAANFILWESQEAQDYQRPHRSIRLDRIPVIALLEKNKVAKVEWQFLNRAYVEVTGRFRRQDENESYWTLGEMVEINRIRVMPRQSNRLSSPNSVKELIFAEGTSNETRRKEK